MTTALHTGPDPEQAWEYLTQARKRYTQGQIALRLGVDIRTVRLTDSWATRQLIICLSSLSDQPAYVRELVEMLRA